MADISQSRSSLEALRGVLNRERIEEVKEGAGMRGAFRNAESAIADYEKAKAELRFADAGSLSEAAAAAVEGAWAHYRSLEAGWAFDQVAKLETSLASLENGKRHPNFGVRRFFYTGLRQAFQAASDKLAFIETWTLDKGKSDVLRGHVRDAWDGANAAWDMDAAIEKAGGLPGSWLFRGPIIGVLNAEAVRRAKLANEAVKAQTPEGQKPMMVKPTVYTWETIVHDEINFQAALPEGEAATATRERVTAQRALAIKLDGGLKVEALYSAYKAEKFNSGLTEAEVALIVERFQKMEAPKEERTAPSPEALAAAALAERPDPAALQAAAAAGDSIAQALVNLDERNNGKDAPVPADGPLSLDDPRFRGFVTMKAEEAGESFEDYKSLLSSRPADARAIEAEYRASLNGGNGKDKALSAKKAQKADGKAKAEAKNGDGKKPAPRRSIFSRKAVPAVEEE